MEDQSPKLEPGQVRVTTESVQESDDNSKRVDEGVAIRLIFEFRSCRCGARKLAFGVCII
jgi:hypothetical protein